MKAMVLAAGEGTRLRPLTLDRPKPMVPVVNRPNIGHVLDKLAHAGIRQAAINVCFHGEQIKRYVGKGKEWGLDIRFSHERKVRGTAGSLAPLKDFFKGERFVVLSGDGISELNLNELEANHKKSGAVATIVLSQVDARLDYGLVKLNGSNRVTALIEKPSWQEAFSSPINTKGFSAGESPLNPVVERGPTQQGWGEPSGLVLGSGGKGDSPALNPYHINTGIYLFEPEILRWIPNHEPFDFARDLYPRLLAQNQFINGYPLNGYWCDIGNLREYRRSHKDILDGRVKVKIAGEEISRGVWVGAKTKIAKGVTIKGPVAIGSGVTIEKSAKILSYSIIGDRSKIGRGAIIEESILWESVRVAGGVHVSGCVLADNAVIKENMSFYEGAILSAK